MKSMRRLAAAVAAAAWCAGALTPRSSAAKETVGKATGAVAATAAKATTDATTARDAFEQLKALAGVWEGTAGPDKQPTSVVYRVASGGTVVLETQFPETNHEMITMYHMDGDALQARWEFWSDGKMEAALPFDLQRKR
jgi:hypothetical protein